MTRPPPDPFAVDRLPPTAQWPTFCGLESLKFPDPMNCATRLLASGLNATPNKPCLIGDDDIFTYRTLDELSNRIARLLVAGHGLNPGERVLLRGANSPMLAACWLAVIKCGAIAVTTMALLRCSELAPIVDAARTRIVLCDHQLRDEIDSLPVESLPVRIFFGEGDFSKSVANFDPSFSPVDCASDQPCLIAFTSGTTGVPKGCVHFHRDILAICELFNRHVLQAKPDDVFIGSPPLGFTFGLGGLLLFPLHAKATSILLPQPTPDHLAEAIATHRASIVFTSPTAYQAMLQRDVDFSSVRRCVSSGEPLPIPIAERWLQRTGLPLTNVLGSTEMLHAFVAADENTPIGSIGRPIPGYEVQVVDTCGRLLGAGQIGRLAVRGPTGCRYLDDVRQTDYVQNGWNYPGDMVSIDSEGWYWFHTRGDEMIVTAGYNVAGPEVEQAMLAHIAIAECAIIGVADSARGQIVKAFVVLQPGYQQSAELTSELQDFVKQTIAPYKYPRAIEYLSELPRTASGKVRRYQLRKRN